MNKKELIKNLKEIQSHNERFYDDENRHMDADIALLKFINDDDIENAYNDINKWYA